MILQKHINIFIALEQCPHHPASPVTSRTTWRDSHTNPCGARQRTRGIGKLEKKWPEILEEQSENDKPYGTVVFIIDLICHQVEFYLFRSIFNRLLQFFKYVHNAEVLAVNVQSMPNEVEKWVIFSSDNVIQFVWQSSFSRDLSSHKYSPTVITPSLSPLYIMSQTAMITDHGSSADRR